MTVPADAPPPALGELARRATAVIEAEAELARYPYGSLERAWAARATGIARNDFRAAATASAVLQLVALAAGGAEAKLPWGCSRCGSELFTGEQKSGICGDCAALTPERPADV